MKKEKKFRSVFERVNARCNSPDELKDFYEIVRQEMEREFGSCSDVLLMEYLNFENDEIYEGADKKTRKIIDRINWLAEVHDVFKHGNN